MSNNSTVMTGAAGAMEQVPTHESPIATFVQNVLQLNNGAMDQMAAYLVEQPEAVRMRFIERCGSLVSAARSTRLTRDLVRRAKENGMPNFSLIERSYPSGATYQQVSLNGVSLGNFTETDAGYTAPGWRKPVVSKDAALEKLRAGGVADRKRKIAALQTEIDKLTASARPR